MTGVRHLAHSLFSCFEWHREMRTTGSPLRWRSESDKCVQHVQFYLKRQTNRAMQVKNKLETLLSSAAQRYHSIASFHLTLLCTCNLPLLDTHCTVSRIPARRCVYSQVQLKMNRIKEEKFDAENQKKKKWIEYEAQRAPAQQGNRKHGKIILLIWFYEMFISSDAYIVSFYESINILCNSFGALRFGWVVADTLSHANLILKNQ